MVAEGKDVTFKRGVYADIYVDILGLMAKCDTAPVHHAKTKSLRVQWVKIGKYVDSCAWLIITQMFHLGTGARQVQLLASM